MTLYIHIKSIIKHHAKIILILAVTFNFNGFIHGINLDDERINPFDQIEDFESVVYVKIGNAVCTLSLIHI